KDTSPRVKSLAAELMALAEEIGRTPSQIAINWVRQQPYLVVPILGARSEKHLRDNMGCLDFELTSEQMNRLSAASPIDLGFPHSFLGSDHVRGLIFGKTFAQIDNHRL
ncbi:MAG TPA: aldo/keto reductase, partial [Anaerolineales bacterium]|nr:aldo/keto reductase [Anaerolineales bacterium]